MMKANQMMKTGLSLLAVGLLAACATKSDVRPDGTTDEPVWPKPYSVTFNNDRGTFPTTAELARVKAGMTKDELYKLLGRPHYDEGMFGVREWDYLFHFHTPGQGTDNVSTCQFKVLYDKDKFSRSFFWRPVDPENGLCPPNMGADLPPGDPTRRFTVAADALFAFDKSSTAEMNEAGKARLDEFAAKVVRFDRLQSIRITGHTDRLGSDSYNMDLSQRRAETVRRYLISRGVPAGVMSAQGLGKSHPVKECDAGLSRSELISCLQPNRRVDIEIDGSGSL